MFAIRNLARSAPRSAARFSTKAIRPQPTLRSALVRSSWAPSMPRLTASFHISAALRRQESDVKDELVAKLDSEIAIEEDMKEDEDLSANIKEYIESSAYEIEDKPGNHEVFMTRTFGDETIRITFTTADLNGGNIDNEEFPEYDTEADDIAMAQSGGANTKGSVNQGSANDGNIRVAPEDRVASADREELDDEYDEDAQQGFAAHVTIRIERPGKGALSIEATAQDGDFRIEDLGYYPVSDLADADTAEKDWQRRGLYSGPPFTNLDEDLQLLLERYLEERGINTRMALFIPDYIDHKEQKEYVRWLNNVKNFVA